MQIAIRVFGEEAEAYNRLGKALSEVGQVSEARKSYGRSLEIEPTNTIARRNLDRLGTMRDSAASAAAGSSSHRDSRERVILAQRVQQSAVLLQRVRSP